MTVAAGHEATVAARAEELKVVAESQTLIQRGIKPTLDGRDTIGQAQSGTGKTATFVIGSLQRVDMGMKCCQSLILAPTREPANQIQKVAAALGDYMKVRCHSCIVGSSVREDIDKLRDGVRMDVGTPCRGSDRISKRHVISVGRSTTRNELEFAKRLLGNWRF